jgi:hypothetical protein
MLETAIGAKRRATKEGHDVIGYDFDKKCWFTTVQGQPEGHFDGTGRFHEHKCVYMPATWPAERLEEECNKFAYEDWE